MKDTRRSHSTRNNSPVENEHRDDKVQEGKRAFVTPRLERHDDLPTLTGSEFNFSV